MSLEQKVDSLLYMYTLFGFGTAIASQFSKLWFILESFSYAKFRGFSATLVSPLVGDDKPGGTGPPYSQIYGGPFLWFRKIATVWHGVCFIGGVRILPSENWRS